MRRVPTNTPLQAFVTLNDPVFVEMAQALARRDSLREGGDDADEPRALRPANSASRAPADGRAGRRARATLSPTSWRTIKSTPGRREEAVAERDPARRHSLPEDARSRGDCAAWTVVANVLLNLDGVLTKG